MNWKKEQMRQVDGNVSSFNSERDSNLLSLISDKHKTFLNKIIAFLTTKTAGNSLNCHGILEAIKISVNANYARIFCGYLRLNKLET